MVKTTTLARLVGVLLAAASVWAAGADAADHDNPRALRAGREEAVRRVGGEVARQLVENHEMGVAALKQCSPEAGRKLCEWANTGALDRLGRPDDLLLAVAQLDAGDDVALWLVRHGEKDLADRDAMDAFCAHSLDVALGIQSLDKLAAVYRVRRLAAEAYAARVALETAAAQQQQQVQAPVQAQQPQPAGQQLLGEFQLPSDFQLPAYLPDWTVPALMGIAATAIVIGLKSWIWRGKQRGSAPGM